MWGVDDPTIRAAPSLEQGDRSSPGGIKGINPAQGVGRLCPRRLWGALSRGRRTVRGASARDAANSRGLSWPPSLISGD